ncbi:thermonuclease family protein [Streptomyces sp. V4I2]|uniref:thermonuclease family protein n=1 Tax=Streptomyces sp. V4I2 TaxID=3042280 RepID=UPI0027D8CDC4|nr:thermonuclease family protein [Streptomyces sp. V4I2]
MVGKGLQSAQDQAQAAGFYNLTSHDDLGRSRMQVLDRNWKVCSQTPKAGEQPTDVKVDFGAVKLEEDCPAKDEGAVQDPGSTMPNSTSPPSVVVLRVIDGDTLEMRGDGRVLPKNTVARVRLLEIDTPERGACFADNATARTATLLPPGSRVRAERDVELTDRYDRYLLYVWNEQGTFVNESLVRSGHAEAVLYPPNDKYWPRISDAEDAAQQAGAGLWTACHQQPETSITPPDSSAPDTPARPDLPDGPPAGAPDVDCSDLSGPVWVGPDDPHRLDRDGDGIGCEAN